MIEFDCAHCAVHVFGFGRETVPEPPLCAGCGFIADLEPEHRREVAHRLMDEVGFMQWVKNN